MERYTKLFNEKMSNPIAKASIKGIKLLTIDYIEMGETNTREKVSKKGHVFKSVKDIESFFNKQEKPEKRYDGYDISIKFEDGATIENFRYEHGKDEDKFMTQLEWYLEHYMSIKED